MTSDETQALKELIQAETGPLRKVADAIQAETGELRKLIDGRTEELGKRIDATQTAMQTGFEEMRRHFKVVTEDLRGGITLLAEGHMALDEKITTVDRRVTSLDGRFDTLDLKVTAIQGDVLSLRVGQRAIVDAVRDVNGRLETLEARGKT